MEYSVVIPVYNEEESLASLHERVVAAMEKISTYYEIVYVDDGSSDTSGAKLTELADRYAHVKIISFVTNQGQSAAFTAGFRASRGAWIITLDADLQNPPEEINKFITFKHDYDFITGVRRARRDTLNRKLSSQIARFFRWLLLRDETQDTGCSLRMFKRDIVAEFPFFRNFHRFFAFLVKSTGFRVKEIEVKHQARAFGVSKYSNLKRAGEGIADLAGVWWLTRRFIHYEIKRS
ncbi:MAG: glycosyltransferase family 2 protein [Candidatus Omnitrophota bacterium]